MANKPTITLKSRKKNATSKSVVRQKIFNVTLKAQTICSGGCLQQLPAGSCVAIMVEWTEQIMSLQGQGSRENSVGQPPCFATEARLILSPHPRVFIDIKPLARDRLSDIATGEWSIYHEPVISVRHVHRCRRDDDIEASA